MNRLVPIEGNLNCCDGRPVEDLKATVMIKSVQIYLENHFILRQAV